MDFSVHTNSAKMTVLFAGNSFKVGHSREGADPISRYFHYRNDVIHQQIFAAPFDPEKKWKDLNIFNRAASVYEILYATLEVNAPEVIDILFYEVNNHEPHQNSNPPCTYTHAVVYLNFTTGVPVSTRRE